MKQTKESIQKEINRLWKWNKDSKNKDNIIGLRITYAVVEALRWAIEDTDWEKPLEQVIDNTKILKKELGEK
jgi:hypothetical protein